MRFTIAVAIVSIIFLTVACQTSQEEIKPATTTTPTTTTGSTGANTTKPTSQEIYDTFVRLALKSSDGTQTTTIRKWASTKTQVKIYWDGGRDANLFKSLDKIILDMNGLNKYNKLVRTEVVTEADIIINRVSIDEHNQEYTSFKVTNTSVQGITFTQWNSTGIVKSVVWLSPITSNLVSTGVLRHELTHALGVGHTENTKSIMVAVMNGINYDFNTFSLLDQRILQILNDIRVKHGVSEKDISAVIKEYAAK